MNVAIYNLKTAKRKITTVPIADQYLDVNEDENNHFEEKVTLLK